MNDLIPQYLKDQENAWAPTTLKSESSRLYSIQQYLHLSPEELYQTVKNKGMKEYSIKTLFIRLASMENWAYRKGLLKTQPFKEFMIKFRQRFKHVYQREEVSLTYDEAISRINQLEDPYRTLAFQILKTGIRVSERNKIKDGQVTGKGSKVRPVYGEITVSVPYTTFYTKLKQVGLKPHMLRKLRATYLAEKGAGPADLCHIFGWSNISTAYVYLQPKKPDHIKELMNG